MAWLLLTAYNKMQEEENDLKIRVVKWKELELKVLENSQSISMAKKKKNENTNNVAK